MRNFEEWLKSFTDSIANYKYFVNFEKVYNNIDNIKIELNILNSLINSKNIEEDFKFLIRKYPEVVKAIPILIAKRENSIKCQDQNGQYVYLFENDKISEEQLVYFMRETGLFELIENHIINNLIDYVTGIEVGLDSNARKNRGGKLMEDYVEEHLKRLNVEYYKEMYLKDIERKWNLDLSSISNTGKTAKRFDFVVKTNNCVYAIECNFYTSSGSKAHETARSYKLIALESKNIDNFKFIWITDGLGWIDAKKNLEETFDILENLYCINDLENKILEKVFK